MGEKVYELKKIKKKGKGMPLIGDKFPKMEVRPLWNDEAA